MKLGIRKEDIRALNPDDPNAQEMIQRFIELALVVSQNAGQALVLMVAAIGVFAESTSNPAVILEAAISLLDDQHIALPASSNADRIVAAIETPEVATDAQRADWQDRVNQRLNTLELVQAVRTYRDAQCTHHAHLIDATADDIVRGGACFGDQHIGECAKAIAWAAVVAKHDAVEAASS